MKKLTYSSLLMAIASSFSAGLMERAALDGTVSPFISTSADPALSVMGAEESDSVASDFGVVT